MNSLKEYISSFSSLLEQGRALPSVRAMPAPSAAKNGPVVLVFPPHPDDECIIGGLPLRLQCEANARVVNIPVTFGSLVARQAPRREELKNACAHLGFELAETGLGGLQTPKEIAQILEQYAPQMILFPHAEDWNGTHERVHRLVMDALPLASMDCLLVQTEFWRPIKEPNLMVELSEENLTTLVEALSLHTGEVARNPYHLMLPAWMMDNVRRGGEVVGGQGGAVPNFTFATLYHLSRWENGAVFQILEKGRMLGMNDNLKEIF